MIAALLTLEFAMLIVMLRPVGGFFLWVSLGIVAFMCCYLVRLCLVLIKELREHERKNGKNC